MTTKKNKRVNISTKFAIAEDRESGQKWLKYDELKKKLFWEFGPKNSVTFVSPQEAEKFIKENFKDEDFGIAIYKVNDYKGNITSLGFWPIPRQALIFNVKDFTKADMMSLTFRLANVDIFNMNDEEIHKNRNALKDFYINKIGELIDLHGRCNISFVGTGITGKEIRESECKGCAICDQIDFLKDKLNEDPMKKYWAAEKGEFKNRFEGLAFKDLENNVEDVAKRFYDYLDIRAKGYRINEVAEMYGVSKSYFTEAIKLLKENGYEDLVLNVEQLEENESEIFAKIN